MTEKFLMFLLAIAKFVVDKVGTVLGYVRERKWRTWRLRILEVKVQERVTCANCGHEMLGRDIVLSNRDGRPIHDEHKPHFTLQNSTRIYCRFEGAKEHEEYGDIGNESGWHTQASKVRSRSELSRFANKKDNKNYPN